VSISVPLNAPDKVDSVVVLNCTGEFQVNNRRLLQPEFPLETLRTFDGVLKGSLKYGPGKKTDDHVINWNSPNESVTWPLPLEKPATYEVLANYTALADSAGGTFTVNFGSQSVS